MTRRREVSNEYKERKLRGGVYTITNTANGKYLIGHATNLASVGNRFAFAVATGSAVDPRVRQDWEALGAQAFTLDVLEELEQKPDQTQAAFLDDLKTLEQLWRANLDPAQSYC
ncbi:MAG TPA: GIY-YIG nuclease family protein [Ktedonobacterales bacterium]|nr:GIY-YIG nuclease family protein [Ktedonobacterales bacterium]